MKQPICAVIGIALLFIIGCAPAQKITNFEECAAAGNPVMESYPRQCAANGEIFVEQTGEPVLGGCGTVTPGYNDECCANIHKDTPHPACVGEWKWIMPEARCKFVCTTQEMKEEIEQKLASAEPIKYGEEEEKFIPCAKDSDCIFDRIRTAYPDPILPKCYTENFCKEGICVYNCVI